MLQYMSLPTLRAFAQTAPTHRLWVTVHLDILFDNELRRFVQDPSALRANMRMLGGVISGSFALSFILHNDGYQSLPGDLDIYVPNVYAKRFAAYLVEVEGYVHTDLPQEGYGLALSHGRVIVLSRHGRRVDIIPSKNSCALYPVAQFWGTHLINYLSADSYCVAYPKLTLSHRGLLSPFQLFAECSTTPHLRTLVDKYETRGISVDLRSDPVGPTSSTPSCKGDQACARTRRFFGDRFCAQGWISRRELPSARARMLPSSQTTYWWLGGEGCGPACADLTKFPERRWSFAGLLETERLPQSL